MPFLTVHDFKPTDAELNELGKPGRTADEYTAPGSVAQDLALNDIVLLFWQRKDIKTAEQYAEKISNPSLREGLIQALAGDII